MLKVCHRVTGKWAGFVADYPVFVLAIKVPQPIISFKGESPIKLAVWSQAVIHLIQDIVMHLKKVPATV
ncbi:MAG: hypothetical protein KUG76_00985, partial [Gammaproteobacteria bacterium]|nr:hypothetical protein [Gammaproteobacteria bacterium]